jgi:hypothetical protein
MKLRWTEHVDRMVKASILTILILKVATWKTDEMEDDCKRDVNEVLSVVRIGFRWLRLGSFFLFPSSLFPFLIYYLLFN